ncbi:ATP-binding protein [Pelagibius sp. Alg239-R121]|uniref:ATP-binding protein n=1 Tax=Pelagibius sp. Alg239-R121 TaxID=2993448 RepID=UPI0024A60D93|nr:ATP-binding protein [Pelagibius sp. Alg239-R121]
MSDSKIDDLAPLLNRIAVALERLAPPEPLSASLSDADAFVWLAEHDSLEAIDKVSRVDFELLQGIDRQSDILLDNTRRFAQGFPANNALLWGARGMGKSSLVKAVHATVNREIERDPGAQAEALALVEIHREDIPSLPRLLQRLRTSGRPCILFCDDLSFDGDDSTYKSLKGVLEGGIEGRPANVIFYATSNRRHLMARDMIENERSTAIHTSEAVEEKVSLSDRFGLWLGFHNCDQDTYFAMIEGYAKRHGLSLPIDQLRAESKEWSITRGSRSGRVAWQYIQDLAGRLGKHLD